MNLKNALMISALSVTGLLTSCGGGGGGTSLSTYTSPSITASQFVSALSSVDGAPNSLTLDTNLTWRTGLAGEDDWFVIYSPLRGTHVAVNLDYLRTLTYLDTAASTFGTADEWRYEEILNRSNGLLDGDLNYDIYEHVTLDLSDGYYYGNSGYAYEDEVQSTDVSLLAAESEEIKLAKKVSAVSYTYEVSAELAMSLVSLGSKVEVMLKKGSSQEELTEEDQEVLLQDIEKLTGVSLEEVMAAGFSNEGKKKLMDKIVNHNEGSGITAQKLEERILPELFGL